MARIIRVRKEEKTAILGRGVVAKAGDGALAARGILVMGEKILGLIPSHEAGLESLEADHVIDLSHCFLFPALVDAHLHLSLGGESKAGQRLRACLESGIAAVRDAGHRHPQQLLKMLRNGPQGVEVQVCGWAIHAPGTYGSFLGRSVKDMAEFQQTLENLINMGALFLKVILTGPVDFGMGRVWPAQGFPTADLRHMVSKAKEAGLKVMVHANGSQGVRAALEAGVDTLEHGYLIDKQTLRLMSQTSTTWIPTLVPVRKLMDRCSQEPHCPADFLENLRRIYDIQKENLAEAYELGVRIAAGTDAGAPHVEPGESIYEEMRLLSQAGLGPWEALRAATCNGAEILCVSSRPALGCLEKGFRTHILAIREPKWLLEPQQLVAVILPEDGNRAEMC
ncbi:MAG: amidohydrolase family protein [bacterium]